MYIREIPMPLNNTIDPITNPQQTALYEELLKKVKVSS
jgi:hypothetical protein